MGLLDKRNPPPAESSKEMASLQKEIKRLGARVGKMQEALGRVEARQTAGAASPREAEFRVFSQWGEDGIIQHLVSRVPIARKVFVEFGVESYTEANTRFLLMHNHWSGLVLDGSADNIRRIKKDAIYWQYNLKAVEAFVTRENINTLLADHGISGEIGLLSIDIDGNDYWVWEAITVVRPAIVAVEYNARFGSEEALTIPYDAKFFRTAAHPSNVYYGASLPALAQLARRKGYTLVGGNSAGNNAFFVREDLRPGSLPEAAVGQAYVENQFREARQADGTLAFLSFAEECALARSLPLEKV